MSVSVLIAPSVVALAMLFAAIIGFWRNNNGVVDIAWGIGISGATLIMFLVSPHGTLRMMLVTGLVLIWGVRLSLRIFLRNYGRPEDSRYAAWRLAWGDSFWWRSIFQIYVLQGCIACAVLIPVVIVNANGGPPLGTIGFLAFLVWLIGFFFEARADYELDIFKRKSENRDKLLTTGLFAYSRHPNYFGEALMWWGIALLALPIEPIGMLGLLSPLLLTFLLVRVSGVPMAEARFQGNPEFEAYRSRTSAFIPLPPRRAG